MIKAVLDTNVVVSGQLNELGPPGLILKLAFSNFFRVYASEPLLEEYAAVLAQPPLRFDSHDVAQWMREIRRVATIVQPRQNLSVTTDPDDNRFVECALEARAEFIVTGNTRHFPARFQDIRVIKPRPFLIILASEPRP